MIITEASQNLSPSLVDYSLSLSNCGSKYAHFYALNNGNNEDINKINFLSSQINNTKIKLE